MVTERGDGRRLTRPDRILDELVQRSSRNQTELSELQSILRSMSDRQGSVVLEILVSTYSLREGSAVSHCHRAARYAAVLGRACELSPREVALLELGALLHDIGKLVIPERILAKPGALNQDEWRQMRRHPALGDGLLTVLPLLGAARPIVLQHHERWDGRGYPSGLAQREISPLARVCAVADTLDAMTSQRSYRAALSFDRTWDEIIGCRETQFDPEVVDRFESIGHDQWQTVVTEVRHGDPDTWRTELDDLMSVN